MITESELKTKYCARCTTPDCKKCKAFAEHIKAWLRGLTY